VPTLYPKITSRVVGARYEVITFDVRQQLGGPSANDATYQANVTVTVSRNASLGDVTKAMSLKIIDMMVQDPSTEAPTLDVISKMVRAAIIDPWRLMAGG